MSGTVYVRTRYGHVDLENPQTKKNISATLKCATFSDEVGNTPCIITTDTYNKSVLRCSVRNDEEIHVFKVSHGSTYIRYEVADFIDKSFTLKRCHKICSACGLSIPI